MNRKITVIATVAAAAAAVSTVALEGSAAARAPMHTLTMHGVQLEDRMVGGVDVATDKDLQHGVVTGYDVTSCAVNVTTHLAHCDIAVARATGMLYGRATVNVVTGHGSGVVTGGTRRFAGASGTIAVAGTRVTITWTN